MFGLVHRLATRSVVTNRYGVARHELYHVRKNAGYVSYEVSRI